MCRHDIYAFFQMPDKSQQANSGMCRGMRIDDALCQLDAAREEVRQMRRKMQQLEQERDALINRCLELSQLQAAGA